MNSIGAKAAVDSLIANTETYARLTTLTRLFVSSTCTCITVLVARLGTWIVILTPKQRLMVQHNLIAVKRLSTAATSYKLCWTIRFCFGVNITIHVPSLATSTVMHIHVLDTNSVVSLAYVSVLADSNLMTNCFIGFRIIVVEASYTCI